VVIAVLKLMQLSSTIVENETVLSPLLAHFGGHDTRQRTDTLTFLSDAPNDVFLSVYSRVWFPFFCQSTVPHALAARRLSLTVELPWHADNNVIATVLKHQFTLRYPRTLRVDYVSTNQYYRQLIPVQSQ